MRRSLIGGLALILACGARSELGAPIIASDDGGLIGDGSLPPSSTCTFTSVHSLAMSEGNVLDVRVDAVNVYWNDGTEIMRVSKTGGSPEMIASGSIPVGDFDVTTDGVYDVTSDGVIHFGSEVLATLPSAAERMVVSDGFVYAIAAPDSSLVEALYKVPTSGGALTIVTTLPFPTPANTPTNDFDEGAFGLAVDQGTAFVSFIGLDENGPRSQILAIDISSTQKSLLVDTGLSIPGTTVVADSDFVYFALYSGSPGIRRILRTGGNIELIAPTQTFCTTCLATPLAIDSSSIYFPAGEFGQTLTVSAKTGGGAPLDVNDAGILQNAIIGIAVDDACVYWGAAGDPNIYVAPK